MPTPRISEAAEEQPNELVRSVEQVARREEAVRRGEREAEHGEERESEAEEDRDAADPRLGRIVHAPFVAAASTMPRCMASRTIERRRERADHRRDGETPRHRRRSH